MAQYIFGRTKPVVLPPVGGGDIPAGSSIMYDNVAFFAELSASDPIAQQIDTSTFFIDLTQTESNLLQIDASTLGFSGYLDNNGIQTEDRSSTISRWVTVTANGGTAPTNPANATGENNGTVATCKAGGVAAGTSTLTCTIVAPFNEVLSGQTRTLSAYYNFAVGVGDSMTAVVSYRQAGQGTNTTLNLPTSGNFLTNPATLSLTNIDPSVSITITYTHTATVVLTGGSITIDATGILTQNFI